MPYTQTLIQQHDRREARLSSPINIFILSIALVMSLIGAALLYSAAHGNFHRWTSKHLSATLLLFITSICIAKINIRSLFQHSKVIYSILMIILILTIASGYTAMGAQRWVKIGPLSIQPSEFMKIAIILMQAKYLGSLHGMKPSWENILMSLLISLAPAALIMKQPNLGTATISILLSATMLFAARMSVRKIIIIVVMLSIASPIAWMHLHDYQKRRIITFLNPGHDPLGSGYNIIQSEIAIGSGGIRGQGFVQGSQNQLLFLPENHTDFIFTLLAEEFGFIGVISVLFLYIALMTAMIAISIYTTCFVSKMTVLGITSMLCIHIFINIGMISGILPVIGIPLPFLSFGRSNLATFWIAIGIVLNISVNRHKVLDI